MTREKIRFYIETLQGTAFFAASFAIIESIAILMLKGRRLGLLSVIAMLIGLIPLVMTVCEFQKVKDFPKIDTLSEEAQEFFWTACRKYQSKIVVFGGLWTVATLIILWSTGRNMHVLSSENTWERIGHSGLWISVLLLYPVLTSVFFLLEVQLKTEKKLMHIKQRAVKFAAATFVYWIIVFRIQKIFMMTGQRWNFWLYAALLYLFINFCLWSLGHDDWSLLPYTAMVPAVEHKTYDIFIDEDDNYCIQLKDDEDFRILQLTDIHLGGSRFCAYADQRAVEAVYDLIRSQSPNFIIVTGDLVFSLGVKSFSINNYTPMAQFATLMRNIGIPWAFTYGNHDTEFVSSHSSEEIQTLFHRLSYDHTFNLLYPRKQPDISGRSNQMIKIINQDQHIRQLLFLLDSNAYIGTHMKEYDCVHEDQVRWYEMMTEKECRNEGCIVPSLLFMHMPLKAYADAYEKYKKGSSEVTRHYGKIGEKNEEICYSKLPCRLFEAVKKLKSTKGIFVGHDHYNNISMTYQGIRLTYGLSIDYLVMPGINRSENQRGATLITIKADGSFENKPVYLKDVNRKI